MIKQFLKAFKSTAKANLCSYSCPNCVLSTFQPTVTMKLMYDRLYHKFRYFMKCADCSYVTAAVKNPEEALDLYEDNWVVTETAILASVV